MKRLLIISAVSLLTIVTTSLANELPSDDFNYNSRNTSMWNLLQKSPNVWLDETNQRLEVRSIADVNGASVIYYANGWGFLTANNFSFKADLHDSSITVPWNYAFGTMIGIGKFGGGIGIVTTANNNAAIEAQRYVDQNENGSVFDYEKTTDGNHVQKDVKTRNQDSGVLYISYDANKDELYLSDTGYWAANAWDTIPGLLKGEWNSNVVVPFLSGYVRNIALNSGDAYLDNFVVDSGTIVYYEKQKSLEGASKGEKQLKKGNRRNGSMMGGRY